MLLRIIAVVGAVLIATACSTPHEGTPQPEPIATNTAGLPHITFDPCTGIPAEVIRTEGLDRKPPRPSKISDGKIERLICTFTPREGVYRVSVDASNFTFAMDRADDRKGDFQEFELNGRKAMSYQVVSPTPDPTVCNIDIEATTGVYGILVGSSDANFAPFPDCMSAAKKHMAAFVPYLPN